MVKLFDIILIYLFLIGWVILFITGIFLIMKRNGNLKRHKDSGQRCLVGHVDNGGKALPPCIRCETCFNWIRPENMNKKCEGFKE